MTPSTCAATKAQRNSSTLVHRANTIIRRLTDWKSWEKLPGVELDSNGVPFFSDTRSQQAHSCNTAVDMDANGKKLTWRTALASQEGHIWLTKHGEEITRLFESHTMKLRHRHTIPANKKTAYYNPQVRTKIKSGNLDYRVRGTIGGNRVDYDGDTAAHTASMQLIKILLNSVVSDGAKFMTADIKDFYLGTPLPSPEYMRIELKDIPEDVIKKYDMRSYAHNNAVVVEINKGIYGLASLHRIVLFST